MRNIKKLCIVGFSIMITSCSYISSHNTLIKDNDSNYLKATSIPPLKIPPGLSSSTFQDHFPVSDRNYPASGEKASIAPPGL